MEIFLGKFSTIAFIVANVYYPAKLLADKYLVENEELTSFFSKYKKVHIVFNIIGILTAFMHCHYIYMNNMFLEMSSLIVVLLAISGILLATGHKPSVLVNFKIIKFQRIGFLLWFVLVLAGHLVI